MTVTQASLSPEFQPPLGASESTRDGQVHPVGTSEAALGIIGLTSSGLLIASVLLLGVLARSILQDASLGGFIAGSSIMIATLGVGGLAYALVTARRAGYFSPRVDAKPVAAAALAPEGMHVVPAVPADLGRRMRRELHDERSARSQQAKAIATATVASKPRPAVQRPPAARPTHPQRAIPQAGVHTARPVAPRVGLPAPVRTAPPTPARTQPIPRPTIPMPRPQVRQPRPAAWSPAAPVLRMAAPQMHPHSQAALFQVNAANVRAPARAWRR
jgi:hypothetical protein